MLIDIVFFFPVFAFMNTDTENACIRLGVDVRSHFSRANA